MNKANRMKTTRKAVMMTLLNRVSWMRVLVNKSLDFPREKIDLRVNPVPHSPDGFDQAFPDLLP